MPATTIRESSGLAHRRLLASLPMDESGPCVPSVMPTVSQESYCESGIIVQKTGLVPARQQGGTASERDATSPFGRQQQRTGEVGTERSRDLERRRNLHHTAIPSFASDGICRHSGVKMWCGVTHKPRRMWHGQTFAHAAPSVTLSRTVV